MKMIVCLPAYNRPHRLKEFIEYFEKNSVCSELIVCFHDHDPQLKEGLEVAKNHRTMVNSGKGSVFSYNYVWDKIKDEEFDMLFGAGDDILLKTPRWDEMCIKILDELQEKFNHDVFVLYGNDMIHNEKLCTHPIYSKAFLQAQGYHFTPGYMNHLYFDVCIQMITSQLRILFYVSGLITEHNHFIKNKDLYDDVYKLTNSEERYKEDGKLFEQWQFEEYPEVLVRVRNAIREKSCKK